MMTTVGQGVIDIVPDKDGFRKGLDGLDADGAGKGLGSKLSKAMSLSIVSGINLGSIINFGGDLIKDAEEAQKVMGQTAAVIASTGGAAGVTAEHVDKLAGSISKMTGIDDEAIAGAENLLLTFTNIKNTDIDKTFDRATQTAVDMAAALGGDAASQAIALGKALNDPVKGYTALQRVGVTFTGEQIAAIKQMEKMNDTAGAQKIILDELAREFGGSAEAQVTATGKMSVAVGNLREDLGAKLIPVVAAFAAALTETVIPAIEATVGFIVDHKDLFINFGIGIATIIVPAFVAWGISMIPVVAGFIALYAPIIAIGVALAAVALAIGVAVRFVIDHFDEIKVKLAEVWDAIKGTVTTAIGAVKRVVSDVLGDIKAIWDGVWTGFTGVVTTIWDAIKSTITTAITIVKTVITTQIDIIKKAWDGVWEGLGTVVENVWEGVSKAVKAGINAVLGGINVMIRALNKMEIHIPSVGVGPLRTPGYDWNGLGLAELPRLDTGGIVPGAMGVATPAIIHGREMVLNPAQQQRLWEFISGTDSSSAMKPANGKELHLHLTTQDPPNILEQFRLLELIG